MRLLYVLDVMPLTGRGHYKNKGERESEREGKEGNGGEGGTHRKSRNAPTIAVRTAASRMSCVWLSCPMTSKLGARNVSNELFKSSLDENTKRLRAA